MAASVVDVIIIAVFFGKEEEEKEDGWQRRELAALTVDDVGFSSSTRRTNIAGDLGFAKVGAMEG